MIKNILLVAFRNLMKNKIFIFINVIGIGIAIACCIVAYLNWEFANDWDATEINSGSIYRVQFWREFQGKKDRYGIAPMALGGHIKNNISEVDEVVRYMSSYCDVRIGTEVFGTDMVFADSAFFDLFTFEFVEGNAKDFHNKSNFYISDETAKKYYGNQPATGKPITLIVLEKDGLRHPHEFVVGGVFKSKPYNSSIRCDVITLFENFWTINIEPDFNENSWGKWAHVLFLKVNHPEFIPNISSQLQQYIEPQNKVREDFKVGEYYLENFKGMMARNRKSPRLDSEYLIPGLPVEAIYVPAIMALMLLLIACFNFTNTSVSISVKRLKEMGIRKVMGGSRAQLILQLLGENMLICFAGLLLGLLLAEWAVPAYDSLWFWLEIKLNYINHYGFIFFLVGLLFFTSLIAGIYPAFFITSFQPTEILKGKTRFGGTNWFTRILLGFQFMLSFVAIIMGVAFYHNAKFQKEYDLGFSKTGLASAWINNEGAFNIYRDALSSNTDIEEIVGTKNHISENWYNDPVKFGSIEREVDIFDVGDKYMEVMGMKWIEGRKFIPNSETDRKESVIVTKEFVKQFGWNDGAIGKRILWRDSVQLFVVGVINDVYTRSLWQPIQPTMFRYIAPEKYLQLIVKIDPINSLSVQSFMRKKWKEVFPNAQYNGHTIESRYEESHSINQNLVTMFGLLGFFAVMMTGIGLFTLVSLNILSMKKEIGVRKVLGASISNIVFKINFEFIINLIAATLAGSVIGLYFANGLMSSIWRYFQPTSIFTIMVSAFFMFLFSVLVVSSITIEAASQNPTNVLRDE